ncbi:Nop domain-containing protein [Gonapodya prolifera JEL478]|uniref:Nop domain-containing protein n=1 Tax=Gonapodya prolifera (strain JEL478) TaxID=1344416 RepID=A0A139AVU0_GONPJ|nr:Nop domain-containing protein [Gonapodya prolifera JEL478]|eukprot:KXS20852.1 Nop domain-containing protein [Gonapodya prolifera JEL478]
MGEDGDVKVEGSGGEDSEDDEMEVDEAEAKKRLEAEIDKKLRGADDVKSVAKLLTSKNFTDIIKRIEHFKSVPRSQSIIGPVEEDPEYKVIITANNIVGDIDSEILVVHKYMRDHYAPRFPELDNLVPNPFDYARTVQTIGVERDLSKVDLRPVLPQSLVVVLSVTASTTIGKPLPESEIKKVTDAADMIVELDAAKRKIYEYVESRMSFLAPNLTAVVGSSTSAKLVGGAGGLSNLSKIPSCNIEVIGSSKRANTGLSILGQERHRGFLHASEFVQGVPPEWRRKAVRLAAAKCALAARMDRAGDYPDGSKGQGWLEEITKRLDKAMEPPPGKAQKPLPAPDEVPKKRRGGRRVRKMKEQYVMTEVRKASNRMHFGVAEEEAMVMGSTKGLGVVGHTGKVRMAADQRVKPRIQKLSTPSQSSGTSGLASSIAFTPIQGIELNNPEAQKQKINDINAKWFGAFKGFVKVEKANGSAASGEGANASKSSMGPPPPRPNGKSV